MQKDDLRAPVGSSCAPLLQNQGYEVKTLGIGQAIEQGPQRRRPANSSSPARREDPAGRVNALVPPQ